MRVSFLFCASLHLIYVLLKVWPLYTLGLCGDVTAPLESVHLVVSLFLSFLISQMDKDIYLHHRDTLRQ